MSTTACCATRQEPQLRGIPAAALAPCSPGAPGDPADVWSDRFGVTSPHAIAGDHLAYAVVAQYSQYGAEPEDVSQAVEEAGRYLGGPETTAKQQEFAAGYRAAAAQYLAQHRAVYESQVAEAA